MAHYDCSYCGGYMCPGDCPEKAEKLKQHWEEQEKQAEEQKDKPQDYMSLPPEKTDSPVKSDGGSSAYYELTLTNKHGDSIQCETGDVIRSLVHNDFSLGNIVKACRRVAEAQQGRGKEGVTPEYDLNKIIYFAQEAKAHVTTSSNQRA